MANEKFTVVGTNIQKRLQSFGILQMRWQATSSPMNTVWLFFQ